MKQLCLALGFLGVILLGSAAAQDPSAGPAYPRNFAGEPEFKTSDGEISAGTASVVKLKDSPDAYIVSVRHLLGPSGGYAKQVAAADVPAFVRSIKIKSLSGGTHSYQVKALLVPATELETDKGLVNDLTIFHFNGNADDAALVLAGELPKVGDPVWVVGHVRGGVPDGEVMHRAVVNFSQEGQWLTAQFDNDHIIPAGASGAPVLNAKGEVVGVYSRHGDKDGHVIAFIVPSVLIQSIIKSVPAGN